MNDPIQIRGPAGARFIVAEGDQDSGLIVLVNASLGYEGLATFVYQGNEEKVFVRTRHVEHPTQEYFCRTETGGEK